MSHPMNRPECQIDTPQVGYEPTPQDLIEAAEYFDSLEWGEENPYPPFGDPPLDTDQ